MKRNKLLDSFDLMERYGVSTSLTANLSPELDAYLQEIEERRADYLERKAPPMIRQAFYIRDAVLRIGEIQNETSARAARGFAMAVYGEKTGVKLFRQSQSPTARRRLSDEPQIEEQRER